MKQALVDAKPYRMTCAGVTSYHASQAAATRAAIAILHEWLALGYRRTATVFYRDGSVCWSTYNGVTVEQK
jgi:hypothetical protein